LISRFNVSVETAQIIGQLLQTSSVLDHVTFDHPFENAELFYRFSDAQAYSQLSLPKVFDVLHCDVRALDRRYMGKTYRQSFLGAEGADVVAKHFSVTHDTAVRWIQQLVDLGLVRHVTNEHRFKPTENFYEFCGMAATAQKGRVVEEFSVDAIPAFASAIF
jgi:Domain found in Dishevelled, Egl-10, and Pleckstrin (DEP)